jgi:hypothetical protein
VLRELFEHSFDHRDSGDGQELLGDGRGQRSEARPESADKDYRIHGQCVGAVVVVVEVVEVEIVEGTVVVVVVDADAISMASRADAGGWGGAVPEGTKTKEMSMLCVNLTELASVVVVAVFTSKLGHVAISTCPVFPASGVPAAHFVPDFQTLRDVLVP